MRVFYLMLLLLMLFCQGCSEVDSPGTVHQSTEIRLATWNMFLRPADLEGGILPKSDPECRAKEAGQYLATRTPRIDFIGLQEMFDINLQELLIAESAAVFPTQDGPRPKECEREGPCAIQPGGYTLLANERVRVGETFAIGYSQCQQTDCLANKGIFYVPLFVSASARPDLHVVITHLQAASGDVPASQIRASQFVEIRDFLEPIVCDGGDNPSPVALLGDLNTVHFENPPEGYNNDDYDGSRESLELSCLGKAKDVFDGVTAAGTLNCSGALLPQPCPEPPSDDIRIDHIWYWPAEDKLTLLAQNIDPVTTTTCETSFLSDHRLVEAAFSLKH